MAEVANGEQKPDVEMNEAGSEVSDQHVSQTQRIRNPNHTTVTHRPSSRRTTSTSPCPRATGSRRSRTPVSSNKRLHSPARRRNATGTPSSDPSTTNHSSLRSSTNPRRRSTSSLASTSNHRSHPSTTHRATSGANVRPYTPRSTRVVATVVDASRRGWDRAAREAECARLADEGLLEPERHAASAGGYEVSGRL